MSSQGLTFHPSLYSGHEFPFRPQPFIAPGLSLSDSSAKFLGVFTASHLSICLLVSGFGLIVTGLLGVVSRASLNATANQAVGISLICFGSFLILIAIAIFVFAIRWGRKKVHVMDRTAVNQTNIPMPLMPVSYQLPLMPNLNPNQTTTFDSLQNQFPKQTFFTIPLAANGVNGLPPHHQLVLVGPSAPPQTQESHN